MQDSITFLGTGGDASVVGKQRRASGGIVIRLDGYQFHIDPGPGSLNKASEFDINVRATTAILVSHNHLNHSNDVNALISSMTYNGLDQKGVLIAPSSVVDGTESISPSLSNFHKTCVERVILIKDSQRVGIENIEIQALFADHSDPFAVGYKIYTPHFVLSYTGDTVYSADLWKEYEGSDILILNTVYPSGMKSKENLTIDDAEKILFKVKPRLAIITHFGSKLLDSDPIYISRELQKKTGVQIIAAVDGLEVHPYSYAAQMKQKTLNLYN